MVSPGFGVQSGPLTSLVFQEDAVIWVISDGIQDRPVKVRESGLHKLNSLPDVQAR